MIKHFVAILLFQVIAIEAFTQNSNLESLKPFLKKSIAWPSKTLHKTVPLKIYYAGNITENPAGDEVIVYLKNKVWERVGQEADLSILQDYIQKNFIVITVDYGNDPKAVSPYFDADLDAIMKAVFGFRTPSLLSDINLLPREFRCFFLPEGYRLATNLTYWEIDKHAVEGTMEFIMESYNEDVVSKYPGLKKVKTPSEMVDKKGNPFDYAIKMDIVYPSQPKRKLPVIFFSDYFAARNPNSSPENYLPHFAGFTTRGYIYADIGHCYNPCVPHFFHFIKFTLDHENGYACYTAAIRYLRAHADKYGIESGNIGGAGISKGEYAITRLSDPNHESKKDEIRKFEGFSGGSPQPQPWQGFSSKISAGLQGMGMGLFETQYITKDYEPNLVICGEHEREVITDAYQAFVKKCEELDVNHIGLFMKDLGHEFPHGYDSVIGVNRYELVHNFFDRYLKIGDKLPPTVQIVSPFGNKKDVPPNSPISVTFAPVIDEKTIIGQHGIKVLRVKTNKEIKGRWKASLGGTKFTFYPENPLYENEMHRILISKEITDMAGNKLGKDKVVRFKVAKSK